MFQTGKAYKVKVEAATGEVGVGRATIVEKDGHKLLIQLKTGKDSNSILPRNSKVWFVDTPGRPFAGLWTSTVTGSRIISGKTVMECSAPKFEAVQQRRATNRVPLDCPVSIVDDVGRELPFVLWSRNISRSGIGIEAADREIQEFEPGTNVNLVIQSNFGRIPVKCRVIRNEYNWLTNQNFIGLEFTELSPVAASALNRQLESIGGISARLEGDADKMSQTGNLSNWMRASQQNMRLVKPKSGDGTTPEGSADGGQEQN